MENSVLERIRKSVSSLPSKNSINYRDIRDIKKEFSGSAPKKALPKGAPAVKSGRPKIDEKLKAKDIRITLKAKLFDIVEKRKKTAKSRSAALADLLEKGLSYEQLRYTQANDLKRFLKEFATIFTGLKVRKSSSIWRAREVSLEENEDVLSKLYKKSLQIQHYLSLAQIDPAEFNEVRHLLTKKEIRYLEFSSVPERIASIVTVNS